MKTVQVLLLQAFEAIRLGHTPVLARLLETADVRVFITRELSSGRTLVHRAAESMNSKVLKVVMQAINAHSGVIQACIELLKQSKQGIKVELVQLPLSEVSIQKDGNKLQPLEGLALQKFWIDLLSVEDFLGRTPFAALIEAFETKRKQVQRSASQEGSNIGLQKPEDNDVPNPGKLEIDMPSEKPLTKADNARESEIENKPKEFKEIEANFQRVLGVLMEESAFFSYLAKEAHILDSKEEIQINEEEKLIQIEPYFRDLMAHPFYLTYPFIIQGEKVNLLEALMKHAQSNVGEKSNLSIFSKFISLAAFKANSSPTKFEALFIEVLLAPHFEKKVKASWLHREELLNKAKDHYLGMVLQQKLFQKFLELLAPYSSLKIDTLQKYINEALKKTEDSKLEIFDIFNDVKNKINNSLKSSGIDEFLFDQDQYFKIALDTIKELLDDKSLLKPELLSQTPAQGFTEISKQLLLLGQQGINALLEDQASKFEHFRTTQTLKDVSIFLSKFNSENKLFDPTLLPLLQSLDKKVTFDGEQLKTEFGYNELHLIVLRSDVAAISGKLINSTTDFPRLGLMLSEVNVFGETPYDIALKMGYSEVIEAVRRAELFTWFRVIFQQAKLTVVEIDALITELISWCQINRFDINQFFPFPAEREAAANGFTPSHIFAIFASQKYEKQEEQEYEEQEEDKVTKFVESQLIEIAGKNDGRLFMRDKANQFTAYHFIMLNPVLNKHVDKAFHNIEKPNVGRAPSSLEILDIKEHIRFTKNADLLPKNLVMLSSLEREQLLDIAINVAICEIKKAIPDNTLAIGQALANVVALFEAGATAKSFINTIALPAEGTLLRAIIDYYEAKDGLFQVITDLHSVAELKEKLKKLSKLELPHLNADFAKYALALNKANRSLEILDQNRNKIWSASHFLNEHGHNLLDVWIQAVGGKDSISTNAEALFKHFLASKELGLLSPFTGGLVLFAEAVQFRATLYFIKDNLIKDVLTASFKQGRVDILDQLHSILKAENKNWTHVFNPALMIKEVLFEKGMTPLEYAVIQQDSAMVSWLLKNGADIIALHKQYNSSIDSTSEAVEYLLLEHRNQAIIEAIKNLNMTRLAALLSLRENNVDGIIGGWETVDLRGQSFTDVELELVFSVIASLNSIKYLNLGGEFISPRAAQSLATCLGTNDSLTFIDLRATGINDNIFRQFISSGTRTLGYKPWYTVNPKAPKLKLLLDQNPLSSASSSILQVLNPHPESAHVNTSPRRSVQIFTSLTAIASKEETRLSLNAGNLDEAITLALEVLAGHPLFEWAVLSTMKTHEKIPETASKELSNAIKAFYESLQEFQAKYGTETRVDSPNVSEIEGALLAFIGKIKSLRALLLNPALEAIVHMLNGLIMIKILNAQSSKQAVLGNSHTRIQYFTNTLNNLLSEFLQQAENPNLQAKARSAAESTFWGNIYGVTQNWTEHSLFNELLNVSWKVNFSVNAQKSKDGNLAQGSLNPHLVVGALCAAKKNHQEVIAELTTALAPIITLLNFNLETNDHGVAELARYVALCIVLGVTVAREQAESDESKRETNIDNEIISASYAEIFKLLCQPPEGGPLFQKKVSTRWAIKIPFSSIFAQAVWLAVVEETTKLTLVHVNQEFTGVPWRLIATKDLANITANLLPAKTESVSATPSIRSTWSARWSQSLLGWFTKSNSLSRKSQSVQSSSKDDKNKLSELEGQVPSPQNGQSSLKDNKSEQLETNEQAQDELKWLYSDTELLTEAEKNQFKAWWNLYSTLKEQAVVIKDNEIEEMEKLHKQLFAIKEQLKAKKLITPQAALGISGTLDDQLEEIVAKYKEQLSAQQKQLVAESSSTSLTTVNLSANNKSEIEPQDQIKGGYEADFDEEKILNSNELLKLPSK